MTLPRSDTGCQNSFDFCGDAGPADCRYGTRKHLKIGKFVPGRAKFTVATRCRPR